jgi:hypothetical protein
MKVEDHEDEMPAEFDFSRAVRGAFADRWTPEEREAMMRDSAYGTVRAITRYSRERVQALEAALFSYLVLAGHETSQEAASHAGGLLQRFAGRSAANMPFEPALTARLRKLAAECEWLENQPPLPPYASPGSFTSRVDRLEAIHAEAKALQAAVDQLIQQHLARSGMSAQEIEQKAAETARLWLAA